MPERREAGPLPLLAYGVLGVIALARRGEFGRPRPAPSAPAGAEAHPDRRAKGEPKREGGSDPSACARPHKDKPSHAERAGERGRGRRASAPWSIPWRGWKDILWRTYAGINDNRLMSVSAGVVFYGLLALFPAIVVFVSLYGLFADPSTIDSQISALSGVLPSGALQIVHEELRRIAANKSANGIGFIFGLLFGLWSANSGTKAIMDALNVAYDEKEKRSFIRYNLVSLLYTLIAIVCLMLAVSAVVVAPIILNTMGLGAVAGTLIAVVRWPLLIAFVIVVIAAAYRYLPCRREPRWEWLSVGSLFAAIVWFATSLLFSWYIANFGTYNVTYGSLGAAVGMMMWMWISMLVILVGAQLNAEIEHQTARDSTDEPEKPLGERGAVKADTIGAAQD
jgi:membrane protein